MEEESKPETNKIHVKESNNEKPIIKSSKSVINSLMTFALVIIGAIIIWSTHIVFHYEKVVLYKWGKYEKVYGAGVHFVPPIYKKAERIDMRIIVADVEKQDVITNDNVTVQVDGVIYYKVIDAEKAINTVEDYKKATIELAKTTLRSVCGQSTLNMLNSERQNINKNITEIVDKQTKVWGVELSKVEIKHINLYEEMRETMAEVAIAERRKEALLIKSNAEIEAASKFVEASKLIGNDIVALKLRNLEALEKIAEDETTILIPMPFELSNILKTK